MSVIEYSADWILCVRNSHRAREWCGCSG